MLSFPQTAVKIVLVWGCLIFNLSGGVQADTADAVQDRKKKIQTQITQEQERIQAFTQKEAQLIQELDAIDFQLNRAAVSVAELSSRIRRLDETMTALRSDLRKLSQRIDERRKYAEERLEALYRLHAEGGLNLAAPPAGLYTFLVTRRAMEQVVNADYDMIEGLSRDLAGMKTIEARLGEQKAAMDRLEKDLAAEMQVMARTSRKKQEILEAVQQEKRMSHAALTALKESAHALDQQIAAIQKQGGTPRSPAAFSLQKGRLMPPVPGKIISRFGIRQTGDYKSFTFQSGIDIRGEQGEPVRSVFKGNVVYAQWLKGYGNMVIIDHGENYYTLYAHLHEMFRKTGDAVDTGEVIATVGDTGSLKGVRLHFELRHHGKPVDPLEWLNKEHKNS
jgi:septal ring factor EnvC (AmiA/AmiB activator)